MPEDTSTRPPFLAAPARLAALCLGLAGAAVLVDAAWLAPGEKLTREDGAIETLSAVYYLGTLAVLLRLGGWRTLWPGGVLLLAMALRELDADKRFTSEGILSIKILTHDTAVWEKALGVGVVALLVAAVVALLRRWWRPFVRALRALRTWALAAAGAIVVLVVSKAMDGLGRKLAGIGIRIAPEIDRKAGMLEEVLELGIPILLLVAVASWFRRA